MNFGSLGQSPEAPQSSTASSWDDSNEAGAQLLELHTGAGVVYVCPSRWQRIRLQWAFRHFHVLPLQVLSRSDQRLIEKLIAVVNPRFTRGRHHRAGSGRERASEAFGACRSYGHDAAAVGAPQSRSARRPGLQPC